MHNFAIIQKNLLEKPKTGSLPVVKLALNTVQKREDDGDEEHSPLNAKEKSEILSKDNSRDLTKIIGDVNPSHRTRDIAPNSKKSISLIRISFLGVSSINAKKEKTALQQPEEIKSMAIPQKKRKTIWRETNKIIQQGFAKMIQLNESRIELGDNSIDSNEFEDEITSDEEATKESENNDEGEEDDELNSSAVHPLENPTTFSDNIDCESYFNYLQVHLWI